MKGIFECLPAYFGRFIIQTDHILHVNCAFIVFQKSQHTFFYLHILPFIIVFLYEDVFAKNLELLVSAWMTTILRPERYPPVYNCIFVRGCIRKKPGITRLCMDDYYTNT